MNSAVPAVLISVLAVPLHGHSWVECTNYHKEILGQDFDPNECSGYIRDWASYNSPGFAVDRGTNYFGSPGAYCPKALGTPPDYTGSYTAAYPMAQYAVGETVRIVWPAKNHANYECISNIPDTEMKLYANLNANPTADAANLEAGGWELILDWHVGTAGGGTDGVPFQNCPKFCEATDAAVCYGDVVIPPDKFPTSGVYSFMWYWVFNPGAPYTSCWEAYVDATAVSSTNFDDAESGENDVITSWALEFPVCVAGGDGTKYSEAAFESLAEFQLGEDVTLSEYTALTNSWEVTVSLVTTDGTLLAEKSDALLNAVKAQYGADEVTICGDVTINANRDGAASVSAVMAALVAAAGLLA